MTPTRFNFLWNQRAKARIRLNGRLFVVKAEAHTDPQSQSMNFKRVICIDIQKALTLALICLMLAYAGAAAALHHWMQRHASETVTWTDCLLAPVRYDTLRASLHHFPQQPSQPKPSPTPPVTTLQSVTAMAENVESSTRKRIELVDHETAFFKNLANLQKAGGDDEILSNLSLARRRSPSWFLRRQTELTQLEIAITARQGDLLALRGAASAYLNGTTERAVTMTASAQHLLEEKRSDAAIALLEEIVRKAPDYSPAKALLKSSTTTQ